MPSKSATPQPEDKKTPSKAKEVKKHSLHPFLYAFSVIILVIIVVTFVGAPVVGQIGGTGRIIFGYYKNKAIEYVPGNYFSRQKDLIAEQIRSTGEKEQNIEYQLYQVWRGAFDRTVFQTAVVSAMEESGAHVSENYIDEALARYPGFYENGEFSERRYKQTSNAERFVIRNTTRDSLLFQTYIQDLGSVRMSTAEKDFFKSLASPERKFKFVNFTFASYPDAEVAAYGEANTDKFSRIKLSLITVTTGKTDAEKVHEQAAAKTTSFEDLAKAQSKDSFAEKGGDMGWQFSYELDNLIKNREDIKKVFALKSGEISSPIEGPNGWIIFRADEAAVLPDFKDADVLKTVRSYMTSFERGKIEDYILGKAKSFKDSSSAETFESSASKQGLALMETGYFPINYGNSIFLRPVTQSNDALGSAAFREVFFSIAFSLKKDEISEPIVLRDNVVLLKLVDEKNAEENDLAMLDMYMPYILQQFQEENLQQFVMNTKDLTDNFNEEFTKIFLPKTE